LVVDIYRNNTGQFHYLEDPFLDREAECKGDYTLFSVSHMRLGNFDPGDSLLAGFLRDARTIREVV